MQAEADQAPLSTSTALPPTRAQETIRAKKKATQPVLPQGSSMPSLNRLPSLQREKRAIEKTAMNNTEEEKQTTSRVSTAQASSSLEGTLTLATYAANKFFGTKRIDLEPEKTVDPGWLAHQSLKCSTAISDALLTCLGYDIGIESKIEVTNCCESVLQNPNLSTAMLLDKLSKLHFFEGQQISKDKRNQLERAISSAVESSHKALYSVAQVLDSSTQQVPKKPATSWWSGWLGLFGSTTAVTSNEQPLLLTNSTHHRQALHP